MREPLTQTSASELPRLGRYEVLFDLDDDGFVSRAVARVRGPSAGPSLVELAKVDHGLALEAEVRAAFLAEARAAGRVRHVNFVQPVDTLSVEGDLYVATELTLGARLDELWRVARAEKFEIPLAVNLRILLDVLAGISALHAAALSGISLRPLVHGDVCPANISIGYRGDSRLVHSGISAAASRVGASGQRNPRLPYKAPEQLRAGVRAVSIGPSADVFAVGVMVWEALKGEGAFEAGTDVEVVERICFGALPALDPGETRFTHLALSPLVRAALNRNPDRRIPDAAELGDAIERTHGVRAASVEEVARIIDQLLGPALEQRRERLEEAVARAEQKTPSDRSFLGADQRTRGAASFRPPAGFMYAKATGSVPPPASAAPSAEPASETRRAAVSARPAPFSYGPSSVQAASIARSLEDDGEEPAPARSRRVRGARVVGWAYAIGLVTVVLALVWIWRLDGLSLPMRTGEGIDTDIAAPAAPKRPVAIAAPVEAVHVDNPAASSVGSAAPPPSSSGLAATAARPSPAPTVAPVIAPPRAPAPPTPVAAAPVVAPARISPPVAVPVARPRPPVSTAPAAPSKPAVRPESDIPEEI